MWKTSALMHSQVTTPSTDHETPALSAEAGVTGIAAGLPFLLKERVVITAKYNPLHTFPRTSFLP